jgi:hypothetical protein
MLDSSSPHCLRHTDRAVWVVVGEGADAPLRQFKITGFTSSPFPVLLGLQLLHRQLTGDRLTPGKATRNQRRTSELAAWLPRT